MFGLREDIVDIPYDMISTVRTDKGVFFQLILYLKLLNSLIRRRGKLDRLMMIDKDEIRSEQMEEEEEDGIITAFPRIKLENYWR